MGHPSFGRLRVVLAAGVAAGLMLRASSAQAQSDRPQRQYHGLFGGSAPSGDQPTTLDLTASLFEGYDQNLAADQPFGTGADPRNQVGGTYTAASASLAYSHASRYVDFNASGGSSLRYYPDLSTFTATSHQAAVGMTVHHRKTKFVASVGGFYSPLFTFSPFIAAGPVDPGLIARPATDVPATRQTALGLSGDVAFEQGIGARSSLSFMGTVVSTQFSGSSARFTSNSVGGRYRHQLNSVLGLRLGYQRQNGQYALVGPQTVANNIDAGLDFSKPLGLTRRTTMNFNFGSSIFQFGRTRTYQLVGDASLNHEFGRSWVAAVAFNRGLGFVQGLYQPYFSNAVSASLSGLFTRRLHGSIDGSYNNGQIGVVGQGNGMNAYAGSARLRFAFNRITAVYGEYTAYRYRFASAADVVPGLPTHLNRQGVRAGLTLWLPLFP